MKLSFSTLRRWLPLVLLLIIIVCFMALGLEKYLNFNFLKTHRDLLLQWTKDNYFVSMIAFVLTYVVIVALSVPGAAFLTLLGGFLFGNILGTILVLIGATCGSTCLFLIVNTAMGEWFARKAGHLANKLKKGFQENAFNYLLFLRLIPVFPFWLVNIVPALLDVKLITFVSATFIGIIPGTIVYVSLGNGLNSLFLTNQAPNLGIIFEPHLLLPLIGLAILSLVPILYKKYKGQKNGK